MNRCSHQAVIVQLLRKAIGAVLRAGEYEYLLPVLRADFKRQQFTLARFVHRVNDLLDEFRAADSAVESIADVGM